QRDLFDHPQRHDPIDGRGGLAQLDAGWRGFHGNRVGNRCQRQRVAEQCVLGGIDDDGPLLRGPKALPGKLENVGARLQPGQPVAPGVVGGGRTPEIGALARGHDNHTARRRSAGIENRARDRAAGQLRARRKPRHRQKRKGKSQKPWHRLPLLNKPAETADRTAQCRRLADNKAASHLATKPASRRSLRTTNGFETPPALDQSLHSTCAFPYHSLAERQSPPNSKYRPRASQCRASAALPIMFFGTEAARFSAAATAARYSPSAASRLPRSISASATALCASGILSGRASITPCCACWSAS